MILEGNSTALMHGLSRRVKNIHIQALQLLHKVLKETLLIKGSFKNQLIKKSAVRSLNPNKIRKDTAKISIQLQSPLASMQQKRRC